MNAAHLDYETLADLAEGILDGPRAASANAHLTDCATCQEREAELVEVSRLLAEVPAPSVPAELVSRIDAALAAAATEAPVTGHAQRWRRAHVVLAAAAAAAVVVVGGGLAFLPTAGTNQETGAAAPSQSRPGVAADNKGQPQSASGKPGVTLAGPTVARSGTDYRKSQLATQLADAQQRRVDQPGRSAPGTAAESVPGTLSAQLAGCVARIGDGRTPLLIDQARYEGKPATIIVFSGRANTFDVWVTGADCARDTSDVIYHSEVPRTK